MYWMTEFFKDEFGLTDTEVSAISFLELVLLPTFTSFITS